MNASTTITFAVDEGNLPNYTDQHLAALWHIAQANPAPFGDRTACAFAEHVGREIISRWLRSVPPELWAHQGRHATAAHQHVAQPTLLERVKALLVPGQDVTTEEIVRRLDLPLSVAAESALYAALQDAGAKHLKRQHAGQRRWVWSVSPDCPPAGTQAHQRAPSSDACHSCRGPRVSGDAAPDECRTGPDHGAIGLHGCPVSLTGEPTCTPT